MVGPWQPGECLSPCPTVALGQSCLTLPVSSSFICLPCPHTAVEARGAEQEVLCSLHHCSELGLLLKLRRGCPGKLLETRGREGGHQAEQG